MNRTTLLVFCLAVALFAGCSGKKSYLEGASMLAYWSDIDAAGVRCDQGLDCVALRDDLLDFEEEVQNRRSGDPSMELVRFEAHRSTSGTALAGVWAESDTQHEYAPVLDIDQFRTQHAARSTKGQSLVHFTMWKDVSAYKVAAIWKLPAVPDPLPEGWKPDLVEFGLSWSDLDQPPEPGYHLDDIEVYPGPIAGRSLVAAVWRPGDLKTGVLYGKGCSLRDSPLQAEKTPGNQELPCEITESSTSSNLLASSCPALHEIYQIAQTAMTAGTTSFLRPFDFEFYVEGGEDRLAVLLQERDNKDWLMLPGSWEAIDCRHQLVELDGNLGFSEPRLLDLDLVGVATKEFKDTLHEGVVHDSGTSGPPGDP